MSVAALISKYDESARSGKVEDWTSNSDIGRVFNGKILTANEYYQAEDRYVDFVRALAVALEVEEFAVRSVTIAQPPPQWVPFLSSGSTVDLETALHLVRRMLRVGEFSCVLECSDRLSVCVESDFYLAVELEKVESLALVDQFGLHWLPVDPWVGEKMRDGIDVIERPADDGFISEVMHLCEQGPVVALERWANGACGERWHLVNGSSLADWIKGVSAGVAVAALPDLRIAWTPRIALVDEIGRHRGQDEPVVVIGRPLVGVGSLLESAVFLDGIGSAKEGDFPPGGELGWLPYPDFANPEWGHVCAVTAKGDDILDSLWSSDLQLIW